LSKSGLQDTNVAFGEEECQTRAKRSKNIIVGAIEALNEAFAPESTQVIRHLVGAVVELTELGGYQGTQDGIDEAVGEVAELAQSGKEGHDTGATKAESRSALAVNRLRQDGLLKVVDAGGTVLTHASGI